MSLIIILTRICVFQQPHVRIRRKKIPRWKFIMQEREEEEERRRGQAPCLSLLSFFLCNGIFLSREIERERERERERKRSRERECVREIKGGEWEMKSLSSSPLHTHTRGEEEEMCVRRQMYLGERASLSLIFSLFLLMLISKKLPRNLKNP